MEVFTSDICLPEHTTDPSEATMCSDFYYKIGYNTGTECDTNLNKLVDSAENIVVDGAKGIYYF